jgi:hypothetical protein
MADAGQGVVLAHDRHRRPVRAGASLERRLDAVGRAGDRQPLVLEDAGQQLVGEALLETQLGAGVDLVRHVDQQDSPPVDLGGEPGLGVTERGRLHGRPRYWRPLTRPFCRTRPGNVTAEV